MSCGTLDKVEISYLEKMKERSGEKKTGRLWLVSEDCPVHRPLALFLEQIYELVRE